MSREKDLLFNRQVFNFKYTKYVANMIAYEYLREKMHTGNLETFTVDTPGSGKDLTAPQQRYRKK